MATSPLQWMLTMPVRLLRAVAMLLVICGLAVVMLTGRLGAPKEEE